jgi:aminoglycoside phosphotransferase (APT) family kinase protein
MDDDLADRLLAVLRDATGNPALEFAAPPVRLSGGFWAELLAFRVTGGPEGWDRDLVARIMPEPAVARKETLVQAEVARLGFATPTVRAAGGPADGLGRAFMVMDRAPGTPLLAGLNGGQVFAALPRLAALPETLAVTMSRLHRLDPEPLRHRLGDDIPVATTVEGLLGHLRAAAEEQQRPDLAGAARWLAGHPPPPAPEVICHGDLHPFNLLVDPDGAITVLDWSAALLGPRAHDVAFTALTLAEPPILVPHPLRPVVRAAGRMLARRFVRRYRHHGGVTIGEGSLRWHQAVVCLRALVEVAGWDAPELATRASHPWLLSGPSFASRVSELTGVTVRSASRTATIAPSAR